MTLEEIKNAVDRGQIVNWQNSLYIVIKDNLGKYLIKCLQNDDCIGLTWLDGTTLNGKPEHFYIKGELLKELQKNHLVRGQL
jgi:hypothetical protein